MMDKISQLESELKILEGAERFNRLRDLSLAYLLVNPEQAWQYADEAQELAQSLDDNSIMIENLILLGKMYLETGQTDQAEVHLTRSLLLCENENDLNLLATIYYYLGRIHKIHADFEMALDYLHHALNMQLELGDDIAVSDTFNTVGTVYWSKSDDDLALKNFLKALKLREKHNDKNRMADSYNNIGLTYWDQNDYENALFYYQKSLDLKTEIKDQRAIASSYNNIGIIYKSQGEFDKALAYYEKALAIREELHDERGIAQSYSNIALLFGARERFEQSLSYQNRALAIRERIGDKNGVIMSLNHLGELYAERDQFAEAIEYVQKALNLAHQCGIKSREMECYSSLSSIYEQKGDFEQALEFYRKYTDLRQEINNAEKGQQVARLQTRYESEKNRRDAEIYRLQSIQLSMENERKSAELEKARHIQLAMLPQQNPSLAWCEMSGTMRTASEVGGDYYDYFPLGDEAYLVVVGDATGHGVAAGLVVGMAKIALTSYLHALDFRITRPFSINLDTLMRNLNHSLKRSIPERSMGMALAVCLIDARHETIKMSSAGMPFPFLYQPDTKQLSKIEMPCPPLGFLEDLSIASRKLRFRKNDLLIYVSDGFEERRNDTGDMWGERRLTAALQNACESHNSLDDLGKQFLTACDAHANGVENHDDMTLVAIKRLKLPISR